MTPMYTNHMRSHFWCFVCVSCAFIGIYIGGQALYCHSTSAVPYKKWQINDSNQGIKQAAQQMRKQILCDCFDSLSVPLYCINKTLALPSLWFSKPVTIKNNTLFVLLMIISAIKPPSSLTIVEGIPTEDEKKPLLSEMSVTAKP